MYATSGTDKDQPATESTEYNPLQLHILATSYVPICRDCEWPLARQPSLMLPIGYSDHSM